MWLADPIFLRKTPKVRTQFILLLMLSWVSLPLLLQLPIVVSAVFALLLTVRIGLLLTAVKKIPLWGLVILLIATGTWVYLRIGTVIGRDGGVSFLLLMVVLKAYEGETLRDWQVLLLAQLILMGAALLFNQNLLMAPWLIISLFCLLSSLGLLAGIEPQSAIKQGTIVILLSLPLTVILFVVVPRKNTPLWGIPQQQNTTSTTGLSNTMDSGSISNLIQSNELVFNATFEHNAMPKHADLYWRAIVMGSNQNGVWEAIKDQFTDEDTLQLPDRHELAQKNNSNLISYLIIMEDDKGRVPALDQPLADSESELVRRVGNVVRVNKSREGLRRIHLYSSLSSQLKQNMDHGLINYYLHLPPNINLETRSLAKQLARQSSSTEDFIQRVLTYYREQHFQYTLTPKRGGDLPNHTDYFLFTGREGFCEDFADATVWLARSAGIPARIVTGYQGGEYHADGQFWQIRSKDAHAWTEIWLAEKGVWQRVDPTTAVSQVRIQNGVENALPATQTEKITPNYPWLEKKFAQSQFYWQQWVVNYDGGQQNNILAKLGFNDFPLWMLALIIGILVIVTALPLMIWVWWQGRSNLSLLVEGINLLKRTFIDGEEEQLSAIGPVELKNMLNDAGILTAHLTNLLDQYILWQYGATNAPNKRQQLVWYRQMKRAIRKIN